MGHTCEAQTFTAARFVTAEVGVGLDVCVGVAVVVDVAVGVGVGGIEYSCKLAVFPLTVAYCG